MKTKILSLLMLISCTAVMFVGCKSGIAQDKMNGSINLETSKLKVNPSPARCIICDQSDNHVINRDTVARLIRDFHNKILRNGKIYNAGGFFSANRNPHLAPLNSKQIDSYKSFKLHWAVEDTLTNQKRLFITLEPSNKKCKDDDTFDGKEGVEDDFLQSTFGINDIIPFAPIKQEITTTLVLNRLRQNFDVDPRRDYYNEVSNDQAKLLLSAFEANEDLYGLYQCKDIVFNKEKSLDEITPQSNRSFFYFFGYDEKQTYHRLRLIIAGYTHSSDGYKINFFDATTGASLFRETSRPRP